VVAIDILRALTMVLMIIVNDLWTLSNVPGWLRHSSRGVDAIGFADTIYPAFLFLVGLSLPYAMEARRRKGCSDRLMAWHVVVRSFALIIIGLFLVNGETYSAAATGMPRYGWSPLCCLGFILVWCTYDRLRSKPWVTVLRLVGVAGLVTLAWVYRGGEQGAIERFAPQWWGIIGQIGWAYLVAGLIGVLARDRIWVVAGACVVFSALSISFKMGVVPKSLTFIPRPIIAGTLTAFTLGGAWVALIFKRYREKGDNRAIFGWIGGLAVVWVGLFFVTRPYWGLAKLGATPAWLFLCSAITASAFLAIYWMADMKRKASWFRPIRPAGAQTLLCYLVPYVVYGAQRAVGVHWPAYLSVGWVGIGKSAAFALICVGITGLLSRVGIRLKI
jgi:heparan-alpha-glucosaminide N-acetyltransferase